MKRVVSNILSVLSLLLLINYWQRMLLLIRLKKPEAPSDPSIDYCLVWNFSKLKASNRRRLQRWMNKPEQVEWNGEEVRKWVIDRLRISGLQVEEGDASFFKHSPNCFVNLTELSTNSKQGTNCSNSDSTEQVAYVQPANTNNSQSETVFVDFVSAPFQVLCQMAEQLELRKRVSHSVAEKDLPSTLRDWYGEKTAIFNCALAADNPELFEGFTCQSRDFFTSAERQRCCERVMHDIKSVHAPQRPILPLLQHMRIIDYYPPHDNAAKNVMLQQFLKSPSSDSSLSLVNQYFGSEVSLYFAWLAHYSEFLMAPAIVGVILHLLTNQGSHELSPMLVIYAIALACYISIYLEFWKRRSSRLVYMWNCTDAAQLERTQEPRPAFRGELKISPITDKPFLYYPSRKRWITYAVTYPIIVSCMTGVSVLMLLAVWLQDHIESLRQQQHFNQLPAADWMPLLPTIIYSVCVPLISKLYTSLAQRLNDMENHRSEFDYSNALIIKLTLFWFANSYASLLYIAFWRVDIVRLRTQLCTLLVTDQVISLASEFLLPLLTDKINILRQVDRTKLAPHQHWHYKKVDDAVLLKAYEVEGQLSAPTELFDEFIKIVTQFGMIAMFGWCWPLGAFCCLVNNWIEIRNDAYKIIRLCRRPPVRVAASLGSWMVVLEFLSIAAVVVNFAFLIMYNLSQTQESHTTHSTIQALWHMDWSALSASAKVILLFAAEHFIIAIKVLLAVLIPDSDEEILTKLERERYRLHQHAITADKHRLTEQKSAEQTDQHNEQHEIQDSD